MPKERLIEGEFGCSQIEWEEGDCHSLQVDTANSQENNLHGGSPTTELGLLYLRATVDAEAHLTLEAEVNSVAAVMLVDSGATGVFIHPNFAQLCNAKVKPKSIPREVRVIDGRVINSGLITQEAIIEVKIGDHYETLVADITNTGRYSCILGIPWLSHHDPMIRWSQRCVIFESPYCQKNCKGHEKTNQPEQLGSTIDLGRCCQAMRSKLTAASPEWVPPTPCTQVVVQARTLDAVRTGQGVGAVTSNVAAKKEAGVGPAGCGLAASCELRASCQGLGGFNYRGGFCYKGHSI